MLLQVEYQALKAWHGWALRIILSQGTVQHGERLKAYLLGPEYVPRKVKIPGKVRREMKKILAKESGELEPEVRVERKSASTKGLMYQQDVDEEILQSKQPVYVPKKLEEVAEDSGDVSSEDINTLLESFFT